MKRIAVLIAFLVSSITIAQSSDQAQALLDDVYNKVSSYDNIAIDFKYVLENSSENIKQETRGDVTMQGEKYVLNILGVTRLYDGKKLYTISPEDEEVTISSESSDDENTITPSEMMSFYKDGYTYDMDIVQDVRGRKIQFVKLNPIDTNSEIKEVYLGIDAQTKHIYRLIEVGNNGTKTTLTVNSFKTNEPISKSLFTFDEKKYSDYYINNID
ncbi:outer membrane lipoprotein carrier protein LolA [Psychroserpens sp.]|uniref:LolA family protein n=1 Tax=Psychroserpens sp. TaxID=2020870 RepID=UPI001B22EF79|nr:outer membrane lipoprotein carrier protein LolA [Psychroserpens sp.]MBO6607468.1 outer membrane lipoprotein carrier protein LolA [Psychroserpens sp.]MBO6632730.1 outer membrane lipoprotein carrier protein LolA [Psychroserpens sp.]MBO6654454.1 outer membrane lipoprotein carrier protein LolA [Psychroserpens sp.]MBO6681197.1 outer membrane lipoprotein carrier protein LolA [Psychroserpens sp.]MBO6749846.1 outer membrane lipoprotein carrier protein LolA [Psychroserpens sp.]